MIDIALDGDTATAADASGESADGVTVDGGNVTITAAGTYRLSGELAGQVVVDTADEALVRLILDDATISSNSTAAISVTSAERVQLVLADGSSSTLSDTSSYAEVADVNAALFSAADLVIAGTGSLEVHGNGNDGIASKDGLLISDGAITGGETTIDAEGDGIDVNGSASISGGTMVNGPTGQGNGALDSDARGLDVGARERADVHRLRGRHHRRVGGRRRAGFGHGRRHGRRSGRRTAAAGLSADMTDAPGCGPGHPSTLVPRKRTAGSRLALWARRCVGRTPGHTVNSCRLGPDEA